MSDLLNLENLNTFQMTLFIIGCIFWLLTYIIYIKNIRTKKFVEIPLIVVSLNIAWEFIWSFPFGSSVGNYMGSAIQIGYGLWFVLDCFIFWGILKYGYKQFNNPFFQKNYKIMAILTVIFGLIFFYTFNISGYDTEIGTISAYLDNLLISGLYIFLFVNQSDKSLFSYQVAWYKMLGTGLISVALVLHWSENYFLMFVTSVVLLLDIYYIYIVSRSHRKEL
ncbi:MAG: hypothetical protein KIT33_15870 [Candidatus Kapabacteria bacterium]|nr:hypothetical protein [Ignavibacteriota bacterium]MCW5886449.1 hypothetical protein [Candidatus Kapabacteria bacterium]